MQADVEVPQPSITCAELRRSSSHAIGLDVGLESYLATSDDELIDNPRLFVKASGKLKWLQQKLKRKKKGSRRWHLIQHRIAKLYEHVTKSRKDFFLKLAHYLCNQADSIFAEALNLKALGRSRLAKYCLDAAWGEFLSILSWVCFKRGKYFAKVEAKQTSQICLHCGVHTGKRPLSQRTHSCPHFGYQTHRDVAAAQVVLNRDVASTSGQGGKMLVEGPCCRGWTSS
jgi:putative transposase